MHKYIYTCFNCGNIIKAEKCPHCGYEFSIEDSCPRKQCLKCVHTNKVCTIKNYEDCRILRSND